VPGKLSADLYIGYLSQQLRWIYQFSWQGEIIPIRRSRQIQQIGWAI
jgi:hypothetical protein